MQCVKNGLFFLYLIPLLLQADFQRPAWNQLTFKYDQKELGFVKELPSPKEKISTSQFEKLNGEIDFLMSSKQLSGVEQTLIPPYIANAQKDFAWLSYLLTGAYNGNLGPVTLWTLQLFIPDANLHTVDQQDFDLFSSMVASLVVQRAAERLQAEKRDIADYPIKKGPNMWTPTSPGYRGINYGSLKPWYLTSSQEFLAANPPSDHQFWDEECTIIQAEQEQLDGKKVYAVFEWAGMTDVHAGSWQAILDTYMKEKKVPLPKRLYVRSVFLSALADSTMAAFNSKYTYWVMRPSQFTPAVKPLITVPNHPSYPSAHSTNSGTASRILKRFFPQDARKWDQIAEEAGMSRIWGGIHYPTDHQAGMQLGNQVGEKALNQL